MESQGGLRTVAALMRRVEEGADAAQIADAVVRAWLDIDATLSPIIGRGGVAVLYQRSLYLTSLAHPWLTDIYQGIQASIDLAALEIALKQQTSAVAAAGSGALLQTFHGLLSSLFGLSLTERLLRSVWANFLSVLSAQDASS